MAATNTCQVDVSTGAPTIQSSTGGAGHIHLPYGIPKGTLGDVTGLVRKSNATIMCHDTFESDSQGWLQLFTPSSSTPETSIVRGTAGRILSRGAPRFGIRTPAAAGASVMGIKRMGNWLGDGRYLVEFLTSLEFVINNSGSSPDRPRWWGWGLDACLADGTRKYFYVRWLNYDESGSSQPRKFQLAQGTSASTTYVDLPGATFDWKANENKALPVYLAMIVNTTTGLLEGFRVNNSIKLGSLSATAANAGELTALGTGIVETLASFSGGLNPFFDVINRSAVAQTRAGASILEHRTTYLGA